MKGLGNDQTLQCVKLCLLKLIKPLVEHRLVILTASVAGNNAVAEFLTKAGAREVQHVDLGFNVEAPVHTRLARMEALLANPVASIRRSLDTIDPMRNAIVYAGSFTAQSSFCGRETIGARQASHFNAERKDRQSEYLADGNWTERHIVDLTDEAAAVRLLKDVTQRASAVVSGVPDTYLAMGGSHTYLMVGDSEREATLLGLLRNLARDCRKAIVSSFNRGTPCTYYGYISREWAVDFGPFEALVYWNRVTLQLWAPGVVGPLEIGHTQRQAASATVHAAARRLQRKTGYTGAFCTDGVMQPDGYVIHEINPRMCAGFSLVAQLCGGGLPLTLIDLALRARPAEADKALRVPLGELAPLLQRQEPLIKLWDVHFEPLEDRLRKRADETGDFAVWISEARRSLASANLVPLVEC